MCFSVCHTALLVGSLWKKKQHRLNVCYVFYLFSGLNWMCWVLHPPKAPQEDEAPSHPLSACPLDALRHHFQLPVVWPFWIQTELLHLLLKSPLDGCAPATPPKVASSWLMWGRAPVHHPHLKQVKPSGYGGGDAVTPKLSSCNITRYYQHLPQWLHGVQV